MISVLIPLYNHEHYIVDCLDSVVADGYPELEIIVLDDGSTDDSLSCVKQWATLHADAFAGRIRVSSRENRGLTKTLNELVSMARGEYITLLASDDRLLSGGIQARVEYLQRHPEKSAVFGDSVVIDRDGNILHQSALDFMSRGRASLSIGRSMRSLLADSEILACEIVFNWSVPGPGFMARCDVYSVVGGYDESLCVEDWDFYLRLTARGLLGYCDCAVAAYRIHGSNSASNPASTLKQYRDLLRTASAHWLHFSGIKRFHLLALVFRYCEIINKIEGHKIKAFIFRRVYKIVRFFTENLYRYKLRRMLQHIRWRDVYES